MTQIVRFDASRNSFIWFSQIQDRGQRSFASQVYAIKYGYEQIKNMHFAFLGILDADISFGPDYYKNILKKFDVNEKLGVAGGIVFDVYGEKILNPRKHSEKHHVAGGVQMFRRKCYEEIGGYIPITEGGQDVVAEVMARMYGWEVETFVDSSAYHNNPFGSGNIILLISRFREGKRAYLIGGHPLYQIARCIRRLLYKPLILGSIFTILGYLLCHMLREKREVSDSFVRYYREEQMSRIKARLSTTDNQPNMRCSVLDNCIRYRFIRAFNISSSKTYKTLEKLSAATSSDHIEYMKDNVQAIDCKIKRSTYIGQLIHSKNANILDFGSGCGILSCILGAAGASSVVGVEIDDSRRKVASFLASQVFQVKNVKFTKNFKALERETFDAILLINVISHLSDPLKILLDLVQLLKPHGVMFVEDNNNLQSFMVRRRLKKRIWFGEKWDGERIYQPMRLKHIKSLYPSLTHNQLQNLANNTYGLKYSEIDNFVTSWLEKKRIPFPTDFLRFHAPVNPETGMYHENAFRPLEVETILFNIGLVPVRSNPKYVFDYKKNLIVSFLFKYFPSLSLRICPAFEILALKK
ncbi:MAG: methyltransferase domain-containing protein [Candidatus Hodarchaeota archaeon]